MKLAILLAFLLVSSFALKIELERKEIEKADKVDLKAAISNGFIHPVSKDEMKKAVRGESTPLSKNIDLVGNPVIDLKNFQDLQYSGPINVGSDGETFDVVYDTGSGYMYINTKGCEGCSGTGHLFDPETSSTYESTGVSKTLRYGRGEVTGDISYDSFALPGSPSIRGKFVPATSGKDNEGSEADGIIGLTPVITDDEDLLVEKLAEAGVIDAKEFTTYIAHEGEQSYIEFGTNYDVSDEDITFVDLQILSGHDRQIYWSTGLDGLSVNDHSISIKYDTAILDTGTSVIGFHPTDLAKIVQKLADGRKIYNVQDEFYAVKCDGASDIGDLNFNLGGFEVNVPSSEFIIEEQGYCIFFLIQFPMEGIMLGDQFLRGLKIIHDQDGQRIGFIPKDAGEAQSFIK